MPSSVITLDRACELVRTGDIWVFRGSSGADRAIRGLTNAPVNHVGMVIALDDLPPMMWHAELGRSLRDLWTGEHHRGVQLHDLRAAVLQWGHRYGQRPWLRQLEGPVGAEHEDAALRAVARLDGTPFPSTARLTGRWLRGRVPALPWRQDPGPGRPGTSGDERERERDGEPRDAERQGSPVRDDEQRDPERRDSHRRDGERRHTLRRDSRRRDAEPRDGEQRDGEQREAAGLDTAYCAEVVALTYEEMGLLPGGRRPNWYDPGRFWSGDDLELTAGFRLGGEIEVAIPPAPGSTPPAIEIDQGHGLAGRIRRAIPAWRRPRPRADR